MLIAVLVDQTRRIGLVYQQPGDDQYFQIFLNPDGTKVDAIWSSTDSRGPEVYTEDEMSAIEEHIKNTFGEFENVFHELVSPDIHVDICVVPPSEARDYYTLVTMGMGAHRMNVPEELAEYKLERAELAIALPPDWKLDEESLKDERWYWPIGLLKVLARLPISAIPGWVLVTRWTSSRRLRRTRHSAAHFWWDRRMLSGTEVRSALCPAARRSTSIR